MFFSCVVKKCQHQGMSTRTAVLDIRNAAAHMRRMPFAERTKGYSHTEQPIVAESPDHSSKLCYI